MENGTILHMISSWSLKPKMWVHRHHYVLYTVGAWALLLLLLLSLFVWVAMRQFRPRKAPPPRAAVPTSPTSKRLRHAKSFSDVEQLREREEESQSLQLEDVHALPRALQLQCTPEQCKIIVDTLSKVFAFLRPEYIEALTKYVRC